MNCKALSLIVTGILFQSLCLAGCPAGTSPYGQPTVVAGSTTQGSHLNAQTACFSAVDVGFHNIPGQVEAACMAMVPSEQGGTGYMYSPGTLSPGTSGGFVLGSMTLACTCADNGNGYDCEVTVENPMAQCCIND